MKAEINNENKAKFFAIYWDQCVLENDMHGPNGLVWSYNMNESIVKNSYLKLKPLSQISDEDAIEVAELLMETPKPDVGRGYCRHWNTFWHNIPLMCVDYLRSKGYALPWMGLSVDEMVQAKWIKRTEQ